MRYIVVALFGMLSLSSAPLLAEESSQQQPQSYKLGVILPLSGDFGFFGAQAQQGMEIARSEFGTIGITVRLDYQDDRCLPKNAVSAFQKLAADPEIKLVVGPACSGSILAVAPIAERSKQPILGILDAGDQIRHAGSSVFSIGFSSEEEGVLLADHLLASKHSSVGILYESDEYTTLVKNAFRTRFERNGGIVAEEVMQNIQDTNYRPNLLRIVAKKPSALLVIPAYNGGNVLKQRQELKIDIPVFGPDTMCVQEVLDIAKGAAEGVVCANVVVDELSPQAKSLRKALKDRYNTDPASLVCSAFGYDAVRIAVRALQAGLPVEQTLLKVKYNDGVIRSAGFDQDGILKLEPTLLVVKNGQFLPKQ